MPEEELEKRIRTLEIRAATMLGSIATLAVCCLAFLGFEYYRIPQQVEKLVVDEIGEVTRQKIIEAKENAEKLLEKIKRIDGLKVKAIPVKHGQFVDVPKDTEQGDWVVFIVPVKMGSEESTLERDNALLVFKSGFEEKKGGWKVTAQYKFRYSNSEEQIKWEDGWANVLLIPR